MPCATALCVGIDALDERHYRDGERVWDGALRGAERHAREVASTLRAAGFDTALILGSDATCEALLAGLWKLAAAASDGDLVVFYFSGHGGYPDVAGYRTPTLTCFDRMLFARELHAAFAAFAPGVRVVSLVDACHSGAVFYRGEELAPVRADPDDPYAREFPGYLDCFYAAHRERYDALVQPAPPPLQTEILHFGACREECTALDAGERGGVFTLALLDAWAGGAFTGSYQDLFVAIARRTGRQSPTLMSAGPQIPSFPDQPAFSI